MSVVDEYKDLIDVYRALDSSDHGMASKASGVTKSRARSLYVIGLPSHDLPAIVDILEMDDKVAWSLIDRAKSNAGSLHPVIVGAADASSARHDMARKRIMAAGARENVIRSMERTKRLSDVADQLLELVANGIMEEVSDDPIAALAMLRQIHKLNSDVNRDARMIAEMTRFIPMSDDRPSVSPDAAVDAALQFLGSTSDEVGKLNKALDEQLIKAGK